MMGRMVWFGAPLLGGVGAPAVAVVGLSIAVMGAAFWLGRKTARKASPEPATT
jgi:hypothetical protein